MTNALTIDLQKINILTVTVVKWFCDLTFVDLP